MSASQDPSRGIGLVVSDLHLFAARSDGSARFDVLQGQLADSSVLVLNGDTFDFRWSVFPDHTTSCQAALEWLARILHSHPNCHVHLVLGNHDCLRVFTDRLPAFADRHPQFHWHTTRLRIGRALFLHGDCAQYEMDGNALDQYRAPWREDSQRGRLRAKAYQAVDRLGLTDLAHRWQFPRDKTVARIGHYLDRTCNDWRAHTTACYFGHTHLPFADHLLEGVRYHNTGSAIRGLDFLPITFDLGEVLGDADAS